MSSGSIRIIQLPEKSSVNTDDYMAVDSSANGTKKVQFTNLLDNTLSQENKIAPANVVGDEIATVRDEVEDEIAIIKSAVGSPLKASTVAQMTDKNKIYVYVGSESGYTNGNWYYWNGSAWTSGGVYNSVAVVTDPTLTLSGVPADAKATGDEVTNLKSDINELGNGVKSGDAVMSTQDQTYADDWNSEDIVSYKGGSTYTGLSYTSEAGKYGIALADNYTQDFTPYMTVNAKYIPFDKSKKIKFDITISGTVKTELRYKLYDEDYTELVSSSFNATASGSYEITTTVPHCKYLAFYNLSMSNFSKPCSYLFYNLVCEDANYTALPDIIDGMESDIGYLLKRIDLPDALVYRDKLPSYYFDATEVTPVSFSDYEYLESKVNSIPNGKHFVFITDLHLEANAGNSIELFQYLRGRRAIQTVINGGDNFDIYSDKYIAAFNAKKGMSKLVSAAELNLYEVLGNHDLNTANITSEQSSTYTIPYEEAYRIYMSHLDGVVNFCNRDAIVNAMSITDEQKKEVKYWLKMNYFIDDVKNRIRYIVLNTGNGRYGNGVIYDVFGTYGMAEMCGVFDWLHWILYNVPANYDVVVIGHEFTNSSGEIDGATAQAMFGILKARKDLDTFTTSLNPGTGWRGLWEASMRTMDFYGCPAIRHIIVLNGHWHVDHASSYLGIPIITTQCDAYARTESGSTPMALGTITEQCFDVATLTEDKLYLTRIGAGVDRTINLT